MTEKVEIKHIVNPKLIKDNPIENEKDDYLGLKEEIDPFWNYINSYESPLVVGVFDSWGSGKTSFLNLVRKRKERNNNFLHFEAWKYKEKTSLYKALTLEMVKKWEPEKYNELTEEYNYQIPIKKISKKEYVIIFIIILGFLSSLSWIDFNNSTNFLTPGIIISIIGVFYKIIDFKVKIKIPYEKKTYFQFEKIYNKIKIDNKKYIILDDLDRCLPNDSINLLEDLKGFFKNKENLIFIIPIDKQHLESEIKKRYNNDNLNFEDYFDKIIDIPYYLPSKEIKNKELINKLLLFKGKELLITDILEIQNKNNIKLPIDITNYLDKIFYLLNKTNPREIKKILLNLDLAYSIPKDEKINSAILFLIILIRDNCKLGYSLLNRIVNYENFWVNHLSQINIENFTLLNNQKISIYEISNYLGIIANNNSGNSKLYQENFSQISKMDNLIKSYFKILGFNTNQEYNGFPTNILELKKYIYSVNIISNKIDEDEKLEEEVKSWINSEVDKNIEHQQLLKSIKKNN